MKISSFEAEDVETYVELAEKGARFAKCGSHSLEAHGFH